MTRLVPDQEWWTAEEISAAALPDLPGSRQGVEAIIKRHDWRGQAAFARRRSGRGGGWEYSWQLFPPRARRKLLSDKAEAVQPERRGRDEVWQWYETLPATVQARALERLKIVQQVEALEAREGRDLAVRTVARQSGVGARTIWGWFAMIEGVRPDDRLPHIAPRNRAADRRGGQAKDCDPAFFEQIKSDFLRLEAPPFSDCYRRALQVARKKGWDVLPERTMRRRLETSVSEATVALARKGVEAVKRMYPVQVRDKTALGALEAVNADFHKFDVFVRWPGTDRCIELIRRLHDVSQAPVILIGEEVLPQKLQRWERVSSRVLGWVGMAEATAADVVHLARLYAPTVAISPDLQARILRASRGSIRNVSTNLAGISEFAAARGLRKLDLAAWGDRPFHTGEVPPPRYVAVARPIRRGAAA